MPDGSVYVAPPRTTADHLRARGIPYMTITLPLHEPHVDDALLRLAAERDAAELAENAAWAELSNDDEIGDDHPKALEANRLADVTNEVCLRMCGAPAQTFLGVMGKIRALCCIHEGEAPGLEIFGHYLPATDRPSTDERLVVSILADLLQMAARTQVAL